MITSTSIHSYFNACMTQLRWILHAYTALYCKKNEIPLSKLELRNRLVGRAEGLGCYVRAHCVPHCFPPTTFLFKVEDFKVEVAFCNTMVHCLKESYIVEYLLHREFLLWFWHLNIFCFM